jgi:tetratricopeptide (TPR) repeat protein
VSALRCATAALLTLCAGCAAQPTAPLPPLSARTADANARAAALVRAGDYGGAARRYEEALALARSVEDADAIAASAINLSVVYQWMGRDGSARDSLKIVLDDARRPFSERRRLQAEVRRAILELASHDPAAAAEWAARAEQRCQRMACELAPALLNIKSQLALDGGDAAGAARLGQAAADAARSRGDRPEQANALRNVARARLAGGEHAAAVAALEQALAIDHALADPRKIHADLVELARASAAAGDRDAARGYLERAQTVSLAARDPRSLEDMEAQIKLR